MLQTYIKEKYRGIMIFLLAGIRCIPVYPWANDEGTAT